MEKIKAGILGCTGLVGQQFVKMLDAHPYFEITALSSSKRSAGKKYYEAVDWFVGGNVPEYARNIVITETSVDALKKKDVKVVFSALPSKIAKGIEKALAGENIYVFSNASAHRRETKKIFGKILDGVIKHANLEINASCCRVPTCVGHLESVIVEFDEAIDAGDISRVLSSYRGVPQEMRLPTAPEVPIIVKTEENRPQPLLDRNAGTPGKAKGMAVTVGRIRKRDKKINFFLLVHNTIRGAAGICILNAELAIIKNYID